MTKRRGGVSRRGRENPPRGAGPVPGGVLGCRARLDLRASAKVVHEGWSPPHSADLTPLPPRPPPDDGGAAVPRTDVMDICGSGDTNSPGRPSSTPFLGLRRYEYPGAFALRQDRDRTLGQQAARSPRSARGVSKPPESLTS